MYSSVLTSSGLLQCPGLWQGGHTLVRSTPGAGRPGTSSSPSRTAGGMGASGLLRTKSIGIPALRTGSAQISVQVLKKGR